MNLFKWFVIITFKMLVFYIFSPLGPYWTALATIYVCYPKSYFFWTWRTLYSLFSCNILLHIWKTAVVTLLITAVFLMHLVLLPLCMSLYFLFSTCLCTEMYRLSHSFVIGNGEKHIFHCFSVTSLHTRLYILFHIFGSQKESSKM